MTRRDRPEPRIRRAEQRPADAKARLAEAGHVNIDLDLRLHREATRCAGTTVRVRWAVPGDVDENELTDR